MGKIPQDCIFVTADVVGLDPIIPHNAGLEALKDRLDCGQKKNIHTDLLLQTAEFIVTNNYFKLGRIFSIRSLEPLLTRNLHHLMRAFLWISLRQIF